MKLAAAFVCGLLVGTFFTWLAISITIGDRALDESWEDE